MGMGDRAMKLDRRRLLALTAATAGAAALASPARAAARTALGVDAGQFGLRPGSPDDQSRVLQRAIDECARTRMPLAIAAGLYRAGNLKLPSGAQLVGSRGATRLVLSGGPSLVSAVGADHVTLAGLVLDGGERPLPERRGLVQLEDCRSIKIADCEIRSSGRHGLVCSATDGEVIDSTLADTADVAIHALDSRGLVIARNRIDGAGNNGIEVWRSASGDDGTLVVDNRIENIANRAGGSGQYGNAVNVFRAANVIVRGNRIKHCAFSAVRGNAASNLQIEGNGIVDVREVALYAEFGFEGALIVGNSVDGAGIAVEADTAVTGNVIENAPTAGIMLGWGHHLRDVAVTGNVVRKADIGIGVSVVPGAGMALIADNVIAEVRRGAIVGMARSQPVTGDLAKGGAEQFANLAVSGNRVR